jgi:hypothetical protein
MSEAEYGNLKVKAVDCNTFNIIGDVMVNMLVLIVVDRWI